MASSEEVGSSSKEDRRVLEKGARDAQPLTLAARQAAPGRGHLRVISLRQARNEVVGVGQSRGLFDFSRRVETAVSQVLGYRAGEQHGSCSTIATRAAWERAQTILGGRRRRPPAHVPP